MKTQTLITTALSLGFAMAAQAQELINYGGCKPADYVRLDTAEVQIGTQGSSYEPACIIVKAGTRVTIDAMPRHPLNAAPQDFGGAVNPFRSGTDHVTPQTQVLSTPGSYGYYCTRHADAVDGRGMGGSIVVVE